MKTYNCKKCGLTIPVSCSKCDRVVDVKIIGEGCLVKENKWLEFADNKMIYLYNEAINLLSDFEENDAKQSLIQLVNYVIKRKKWFPKKQLMKYLKLQKLKK